MPLSRFRIADIHATDSERLANASEDTRDAALSIDEKLSGQKEIVGELGERIDNPKQVVRKLEEVKSAQLAGNIALKKIQARVYEDMKPVELLRTIKGDKGDTPKKGIDYFTKDEIEKIKREITPKKGIDYTDGKHGEKPTKEEILALIPPPIKGDDGSPDTPDEIIEKINAAKKKILISQIKGLSAILEELDKVGKFPMGGQMSTRTGSITKRAKLTPTASGANITLDLNALPLGYVEMLGVFRNGALLEQETVNGYTKSGNTVTVYNSSVDDSFQVDYNY